MPNYRFITATIENLSGGILKKYPITVEHLQSNSSPDGVFFPKRTDVFYTDNLGKARFKIWCNEEGENVSVYRFTLPNEDIFDAIVPIGTADIDIIILKNGTTPTRQPQYITLVSHLRRELSGESSLVNATAVKAGIVKTNVTALNPVVYLKSEVDSLISSATGADLSNYYTKGETYNRLQVNNLIPSPVDLSDYYLKSETYSQTEVNSLIPSPVDLSDYYLKNEVNNLIPSLTNYYTKTEVNSLIPSLTNYYTKTDVNSLIPSPVDLSDYYLKSETYSKTQVNNLIPSLTNYYNKTEVNSLIPSPVDLSGYYLKTETYSQSQVNNLIPSLTNYYNKTEVNSLIPSPVDLSGYYLKTETYSQSQVNSLIPSPVDLSDYYNKSEVNVLIPSLTNYYNKSETYSQAQVNALIPSLTNYYNKSETYSQSQVNTLVNNSKVTNLSSVVYDGSNRVTSYSLNGVAYTVTYTATTQVITGGGETRTITRDVNGRVTSNIVS